jgi:hypothetical protein
VLTACDEEHAVTYCRMLDAEAVRADWREVARIVLRIDPEAEADHARRAFDSHLSHVKWGCKRAIGGFCTEARCAAPGERRTNPQPRDAVARPRLCDSREGGYCFVGVGQSEFAR